MSTEIKNNESDEDNYEWIEIQHDPDKDNDKLEYEPGSIEYSFKQKIISNKSDKNSNSNSNSNNNNLSSSQDSLKNDNNNKIKSPSPVIVHKDLEGFVPRNKSWNSIHNSNFDVKSLDSFSNMSTSTSNTKKINNQNNNNNNSKIPFSWAEITKIGQIPGESGNKPKLRLLTNSSYSSIKNKKNTEENNKNKNNNNNKNKSPSNKENIKSLGIIKEDNEYSNNIDPPVTDPSCTKQDTGRSLKPKRIGKKGNRVKYPNGKRGTRSNKKNKNKRRH